MRALNRRRRVCKILWVDYAKRDVRDMVEWYKLRVLGILVMSFLVRFLFLLLL